VKREETEALLKGGVQRCREGLSALWRPSLRVFVGVGITLVGILLATATTAETLGLTVVIVGLTVTAVSWVLAAVVAFRRD
jgi:hypothetical protein